MALFLGSEAIDLYLSAFENGKTAFVHTAYSNDGGRTFEQDPAHAAYIGFRFDYDAASSTDPTDYIWTQLKYDSLYLHLKYKDEENSTSFSTGANAKFIGLYVDGDSRDSSTMSDYTWHRIAYDEKFLYVAYSQDGSTIAASATGAKYVGVCSTTNATKPIAYSAYTWTQIAFPEKFLYVAYSQNGSTITSSSIGAKYVGFCSTTSTTKPTAYNDYTWTQFVYDKEYFYIAYANSANDIITNSANAVQIGFCVSTSATKPSAYSAYTWTNITYNENADQGVSVSQNSDNKTVYVAGYDPSVGDLEYNTAISFNPSTGALTATKVYNAIWNDYAEWFEKADENENIQPGDVCVWTGNGITKCSKSADKAVIGVYSDSYGHILGGEALEDMEDNKNKFVPIGLKGRVKVNVIGTVEIGDLLVSAAEPGCAIVNNGAPQNCIIGKALETSTDLNKKKIQILV